MKNKLLFILKYRDNRYTDEPYSYSGGLSSGLLNSARFVVEMLNENGVPAVLVQVPDNNAIDREVHKHKPTHCIIEAFWVVPEKFDVLRRLHPNVQFIVRNHSEAAFLAQEAHTIAWTIEYLRRGVAVAPNSLQMTMDTRAIARSVGVPGKVLYLPNSYRLETPHQGKLAPSMHIDIGCFGAIRPLKNQLAQAIAAVRFAEQNDLKLRFHINATRVEQGNNVLNNIRGLFSAMPRGSHKLVEHSWMSHERFLRLVAMMDISMCVSFSETFCIVAADSVNMRVPTVASPEVKWISPKSWAAPTDTDDIVRVLEFTHKHGRRPHRLDANIDHLNEAIAEARVKWLTAFKR